MLQLLDKPMAIGKIGSSECRALAAGRGWHELTQLDLHDIYVGAGVFPPDPTSLQSFFSIYGNHLTDVDVIAKWLGPLEEKLINSYCPCATSVELRDLEPYYWDDPWSQALENKNVLVISPFADSINSQYTKRELLWQDPKVLPKFNLRTIKCPLSWYVGKRDGSTWGAEFEDLKHEMEKESFDICLIGAGAWSLPLAVHAKRLGKIGIHLGGALQILFGIKGKRWDEHDVISEFYNDAWVRPSEKETPTTSFKVEGGCYW